TICSDVNLARRDRDVATAYAQKLGGSDSDAARKPVRDQQRAFLADRTKKCGGQAGAGAIACLTRLYEVQLKALTAPPQ
ncbi:MAG TPA: lysozyme inhibitor LprI family protein, partial [Rhizomicrobium sp.]|nr:lysozyme inhibitor LprI family protein [Rhizomicrobium sp.]